VQDFFMSTTLLDAPQFVVNNVIVQRIFGGICRFLVLFLQLRPELGLVYILWRFRFGCGCEAQCGVNLMIRKV